MVTKIKSISNFAIFKDFEWDKYVVETNGKPVNFKAINIIYGRNYSGKTTLSRIVRSLETGKIPDKYDNPQFCVTLDDTEITQSTLSSHSKTIRVFNEDFVKENLKFITNPDEEIESFAVLGDDNNEIEKQIDKIKDELGKNKEGEEKTGLYKQQENNNKEYATANENYQRAQSLLDSQLSKKATDRNQGIKYKSNIYGDVNYNVAKLRSDIETVSGNDYSSLTDEKQTELYQLIKEIKKEEIRPLNDIMTNYINLSNKTKELVERKIGVSEKIEELIKDAILNRWVKEGRSLHRERNRTVCAFCGNTITSNRWDELDKHFDEESDKLEKGIDALILSIQDEQSTIEKWFTADESIFYSKFYNSIDTLNTFYIQMLEKCKLSLNSFITQLNARKDDLFNPKTFTSQYDYTQDIKDIKDKYEGIRKESNNYTNQLKIDQEKAKEELRLFEVYNFITSINYDDALRHIDELKNTKEIAGTQKEKIDTEIKQKEDLIESKKLEMNDEEKGAMKVNEYLANFFGNKYLSLNAIKENDSDKHFKFQIVRDDKKAYHLSEGECSLVAFCYFMAKLEDIATKDKKPIIWIDDPISSLDNNHIFFVYSLIAAKIADNENVEQLFISTHNLDFMKYLKRMNGKFYQTDKAKSKEYFLVNRTFSHSSITLMPKFLKENITEFNYLFREIYKCSKITQVDDSNYSSFYNFGNNARKFLEIFLFYKYPDDLEERKKMELFFGEGKVPVILSERINNEYSHLIGCIERASYPIDVPEMNNVAKIIVNKIKEQDEEQYKALLKCC